MEVYQILQLNFLAVLKLAYFCALQYSIFQEFTPVSIAASFATTNNLMTDSGAGGNFIMTASYNCISMSHFQPYTVLDQATEVMVYVLTAITKLCSSVHSEPLKVLKVFFYTLTVFI